MSSNQNQRQEGARTKAATAGTVKDEKKIGGEHKFETNPKWLDNRVSIWNELYDKQQKVYESM